MMSQAEERVHRVAEGVDVEEQIILKEQEMLSCRQVWFKSTCEQFPNPANS